MDSLCRLSQSFPRLVLFWKSAAFEHICKSSYLWPFDELLTSSSQASCLQSSFHKVIFLLKCHLLSFFLLLLATLNCLHIFSSFLSLAFYVQVDWAQQECSLFKQGLNSHHSDQNASSADSFFQLLFQIQGVQCLWDCSKWSLFPFLWFLHLQRLYFKRQLCQVLSFS